MAQLRTKNEFASTCRQSNWGKRGGAHLLQGPPMARRRIHSGETKAQTTNCLRSLQPFSAWLRPCDAYF